LQGRSKENTRCNNLDATMMNFLTTINKTAHPKNGIANYLRASLNTHMTKFETKCKLVRMEIVFGPIRNCRFEKLE
jgi:hypothetical protein